MDTKLKNTKKKLLSNIIIFIILIASSLGMIYTYPMIQKEVNERKDYSPFEMMEFAEDIYNSSYVIYKEIMEEKEGKPLYPEELFIKPRDIKYNTSENYTYEKDDLGRNLSRNFENSSHRLKYSLKNLEYSASLNDGSFIKTNSDNDIQKYTQKKDLSEEEIESLSNIYSFYVNLSFDDNGGIKVNEAIGANPYAIQQRLDTNAVDKLKSYRYNNYELNPVKNMDVIYAVPREMKYNDNITRLIESLEYIDYRNGSSMFLLIIGGIVLFLSLLVPYSLGKEFIGFKALTKIPFEFNVLVSVLAVAAFKIGRAHV